MTISLFPETIDECFSLCFSSEILIFSHNNFRFFQYSDDWKKINKINVSFVNRIGTRTLAQKKQQNNNQQQQRRNGQQQQYDWFVGKRKQYTIVDGDNRTDARQNRWCGHAKFKHKTWRQLASGAILHSFEYIRIVWNYGVVHKYLSNDCDIYRRTNVHRHHWRHMRCTSIMGTSNISGRSIFAILFDVVPDHGRPGKLSTSSPTYYYTSYRYRRRHRCVSGALERQLE